MSGLDQMKFRAPQSPTKEDIPLGFSGPKLPLITEEDCDRILSLVNNEEQDENKKGKTKKDEKSSNSKQDEKSNKRKKSEKKNDAKKVKKKKPVDKQLPPVDSEPEEHLFSIDTYQPKPAAKPKVIRKQLPISGASPYFPASSYNQEEAKPVLSNSTNNADSTNNTTRFFNAIYGVDKPYKKHKTFSDDGFLIVKSTVVELRNGNKKYIGKVESWEKKFPRTYENTTRFVCAGYLVEFSDEITKEEYAKISG